MKQKRTMRTNQWATSYKPKCTTENLNCTADLEFSFKKLQFCNRYITVQLQQFKKWTQDTLFLIASSDEAVTAHVSILNPSLMQYLDKLPHSAACQANAGNYIHQAGTTPLLSATGVVASNCSNKMCETCLFTSSTISSHQEKLSLILQLMTTIACK